MPAYTNRGVSTYGGLNLHVGGTRREDVIEAVSYVNPLETPLLSSIDTVPVDNTRKDWMVDNIDRKSTGAVSATVEGAEFDPTSTITRKRVSNYTHILTKGFAVSDTQRSMDEIGVSDEYTHQAWKAMLELATEIEYAAMWSEWAVGSDVPVARQMQGLMAWAYWVSDASNLPTIAGHVQSAPYITTWKDNAAPTDLTLDQFNDDILDPAWAKGMDINQSLIFVGAKLKRLMSKWPMTYQGSGATLTATPLNEREIPAGAKRLVDYVDVYETEFGTLHVNKNRYLNDTDASFSFDPATANTGPPIISFATNTSMIIFEPRFLAFGILRGMDTIPLAKTGDASRGVALAELTLIVRNTKILAGGRNLVA